MLPTLPSHSSEFNEPTNFIKKYVFFPSILERLGEQDGGNVLLKYIELMLLAPKKADNICYYLI